MRRARGLRMSGQGGARGERVKPYAVVGDAIIYHGRCEEVHAALPDRSVNIIATDPPYFRVKDEWWDRQWDTAAGFLSWLGDRCAEWQRLLTPNGSLYVFAGPDMAREVAAKVEEYFRVLNVIRWEKDEGWHKKAEKEELRSFLSPWEAVIFAEQYGSDSIALGESTYQRKCDNLRGFIFEPLRAYLDGERQRAGINFEQVRQIVGCANGSGLPSHWFTRSQWILPTSEQYLKLQEGFNTRGKRNGEYLRRDYEELRRDYEELRRPFFLDAKIPHTDIWRFPTVAPYPGKHPCEKPVALMEHIIRVSSKPGDVVLDSFCGYGATLCAARNLGRKAIGIDVELHNCRTAGARASQRSMLLALGEHGG